MKKQKDGNSSKNKNNLASQVNAEMCASRTQAPLRCVGAPAFPQQGEKEQPEKGAPPCNTAPANSIDLQILRGAIDSLYISSHGSLGSETLEKLNKLKRKAQSPERSEHPKAQYKIGDHLFEVMDKGARRFAYVLVNNWYRISLPSSADSILPMAYVQISSEVLTLAGPVEAIKRLNFVVNSMGVVSDAPQVSRVDLCIDFASGMNMNQWDIKDWVTRARNINKYYDGQSFSGWSIGVGGTVGARLYNKILEIKKSRKTYLYPIWESAGWNLEAPVWRLEFEFKREALSEMGVRSFGNLLNNLAGLWCYATNEWLRLSIPNKYDKTQSRWPTHPMWGMLQVANCWNQDQEYLPIDRIRKQRIPRDETLFVNGLAHITSFMAREGITELDEGLGEFIQGAVRFHQLRDNGSPHAIKKYVRRKVAEKGRKFNSIDQRDKPSKEEIKARAKAYRKAKDGE